MKYVTRTALLGSALAIGLAVSMPSFAAPARERAWMNTRIDAADRAYLDTLVGHAPPAFRDDLDWIEGEAAMWSELRGRVVVVQTWTSARSPGRIAASQLGTLRESFSEDDLAIIAVHTPERADRAQKYLQKQSIDAMVVVDPSGAYCDDLGAYKRPMNLVIGRNGEVRWAGLNPDGLTKAVQAAVLEEYDPSAEPAPFPESTPAPIQTRRGSASFPKFGKYQIHATDVRGKRGPQVAVGQWMNGTTPDTEGKVVMVEFWATWCGPCVKGIPHMNELNAKFGDEVVIIGVSDEDAGTVKKFMRRNKMNYNVAIDQQRKMSSRIGVKGIPHAIIMSSDGVVRWQGMPGQLTGRTLQQIVDANASLPGAAGQSTPKAHARRWTEENN